MLFVQRKDLDLYMPSLETDAERIAETYKPPAVGRHSELGDRHTVTNFLRAVRQGNYMETACAIAGLSKVTVYRWLKEAEQSTDENDARVRFRNAVEKARASAEAQDVANVRAAGKAGPQFWAASMTYLERRYPDRWGKRPESVDGPKVTVLIGAAAEHHVQVNAQVNLMPYYQTQTQDEGLTSQSLTDTVSDSLQAKPTGESDSPAGTAVAAASAGQQQLVSPENP